jgi:spore maturation protein CgeB
MGRKFKILRVSHISNPGAILYALNKLQNNIKDNNYDKVLEIICKEKLQYTNSFSIAMTQLGHQSVEVIHDIEFLQKLWAKENAIQWNNKNWEINILLEQIKYYQPDILYFQHSPPFENDVLSSLKSICPSIQLLIVHRAFPGDHQKLKGVDLLFVGSKKLIESFEDAGFSPRLLYHYFDNSIIALFNQSMPKIYPATFIGFSGFAHEGHFSRYLALKNLLEDTPISMWLNEDLVSQRFSMKKEFRKLVKIFLKNLPSIIRNTFKFNQKLIRIINEIENTDLFQNYHDLPAPADKLADLYPQQCKPPVYGLEYYQKLNQSKISFNMHTDAAFGDVGNLRMFQATGMGSCLVNDNGNNLRDLFEPDTEVVTYSSIEEAKEKINYLLEHESELQQIARAGQKRTLRDHTALKRCEQIDEWIQELI